MTWYIETQIPDEQGEPWTPATHADPEGYDDLSEATIVKGILARVYPRVDYRVVDENGEVPR